jgi:hypothetical protein
MFEVSTVSFHLANGSVRLFQKPAFIPPGVLTRRITLLSPGRIVSRRFAAISRE